MNSDKCLKNNAGIAARCYGGAFRRTGASRELLLLLLFLLLAAPVALAQYYEHFGYYIDDNGTETPADDTVTIAGYSGPGGYVSIPGWIDGLPVRTIGWGAFAWTHVTGVTIPGTVRSIDGWAFYGSSLTTATVGGSVTSIGDSAFAGCANLTTATIGSSVTNIGASAFAGCESLVNATILGSVKTMGRGAFGGCTNLVNLTLGNSVSTIGECAFIDCWSLPTVTIPGSVNNIGDCAFQSCSSLTNVIMAYGVHSIGVQAFIYCNSLSSVTIPESVTSIGDEAFAWGAILTSINIPNSVTTIGNAAFSGCRTLLSISIPNSVTHIGDTAFMYCDNLTNVTLGSGVAHIGHLAFLSPNVNAFTVDPLNSFYSSKDGVLFNKDQSTLIQYPAAQSGAYTVPSTVTEIAAWAFAGCLTLRCVTLPDSVVHISEYAFTACFNLSAVMIGSNLTHIAEGAFENCPTLAGVYFRGDAPSLAGEPVFSFTNFLTIYYLPHTLGWGPIFGGAKTAPWPPPLEALRVRYAQIDAYRTNDINAPLVLVTNRWDLDAAHQPLGLGVVADGVTPVLFRITAPPGDYSIAVDDGFPAHSAFLQDRLFILQANNSWRKTTELTMDSMCGHATSYAYLQGWDWTTLLPLSPSNELVLTLTLIPATAPLPLTNTTLRVRPPPVVLVHGYNADSNTWSDAFLSELRRTRPDDFVIPIEYGTKLVTLQTSSGGTGPGGYGPVVRMSKWNTTGTLKDLAIELDVVLRRNIEDEDTMVKGNWFFVRYDVVGHSQGGVLARMLCQNITEDRGAFTSMSVPVVSDENAFRGRFRRVITLGSPHNGSVLLYYADRLKEFGVLAREVHDVLSGLELLQTKFDPFEFQIREINDPARQVDSLIRFNCLGSTIFYGLPPLLFAPSVPLAYVAVGLCGFQPDINVTGGQLLLPYGSDGVVELESQFAGTGTPPTLVSNSFSAPFNIAHADFPSVFGTSPGESQTTDPRIAQKVANLLNGPDSAFGAFQLPTLLTTERRAQIDSIVPEIWTAALIQAVLNFKDASPSYVFECVLPQDVPAGGQTVWFAQVFGPNGVSSQGVTLQQSGIGNNRVTVSVDGSVRGDVVIYAVYSSTNKLLVFSSPVLVVSRPVGEELAGISLDPSHISLSVGQTLSTDIWGIYTNGSASRLFVPTGQAAYSSSDSNVASVTADGIIKVNAPGTTSISVNYRGFTAQTVVSSPSPDGLKVAAEKTPEGFLLISVSGTLGNVNILEASNDLIEWEPVALLPNTNSILQIRSPDVPSDPQLFFRVRLP